LLKSKIAEKDTRAACALLIGTDLTVGEAAHRVGVSRVTRYRHLPAARALTKGDAQESMFLTATVSI
jgi:predicted DNA-binding protein (UPF0251 family)